MKLIPALVLSLLVIRVASSEDVDLHNRADQIMNRALIQSRLTMPINIRTTVSFSMTSNEGTPTAGSYIRIRSADNALREDVALGDYSMSRIQEQGKVATRGR
jgi:hypothetical protein